MKIPTVHLNGTSKDELVQQLNDLYLALGDAMDVLAKAGPNGRDYYPDPGRMEKAIMQHQRRGQVLRDLRAEIEEEIRLIDEVTR